MISSKLLFLRDALRALVSLKNGFVSNFKSAKNTHEEPLLLVKLLAKTWNFPKSNTPPWVFFK